MLTDESRVGERNHVNNVIFAVREAQLKFVILSGLMAKDLLFVVKGGYAHVRREADPSQKQLGMTMFIGEGFGAFMLETPCQC